jgi:hypothetical protein
MGGVCLDTRARDHCRPSRNALWATMPPFRLDSLLGRHAPLARRAVSPSFLIALTIFSGVTFAGS